MNTVFILLLVGCGTLASPHGKDQSRHKEKDKQLQIDIGIIGGVRELEVQTPSVWKILKTAKDAPGALGQGRVSLQRTTGRSWQLGGAGISQGPTSLTDLLLQAQQQEQQLDQIESQLQDIEDQVVGQTQQTQVQQQIQQARQLQQEQDMTEQQVQQEIESSQPTSAITTNQIQKQLERLQGKIDRLQQAADEEQAQQGSSQSPKSARQQLSQAQQQQNQVSQIEDEIQAIQGTNIGSLQSFRMQQQLQQVQELQNQVRQVVQDIQQDVQNSQPTSPEKLAKNQRQLEQLQQQLNRQQILINQQSDSSLVGPNIGQQRRLQSQGSPTLQQLASQVQQQQRLTKELQQDLQIIKKNVNSDQKIQIQQLQQQTQQVQQQLNEIAQEIQQEIQSNQPVSTAKLNQIQRQVENVQQSIDEIEQRTREILNLPNRVTGKWQQVISGPRSVEQLKSQTKQQQRQLNQILEELLNVAEQPASLNQRIQRQQQKQQAQQLQRQINQLDQDIQQEIESSQQTSPLRSNQIGRQQDQLQQSLDRLQQAVLEQQDQTGMSDIGQLRTVGLGVNVAQLLSRVQQQQNQINQIQSRLQQAEQSTVGTSQGTQVQQQQRQSKQIQQQLGQIKEEIQNEEQSSWPSSPSKLNQIAERQEQLQQIIDQLQRVSSRLSPWGRISPLWGPPLTGPLGSQAAREIKVHLQQQQGQVQQIQQTLRGSQARQLSPNQQIQIHQQRAQQLQQQLHQLQEQVEQETQSDQPTPSSIWAQIQRQQNQLQQQINQLQQAVQQQSRNVSLGRSSWSSLAAPVQPSFLRQNPWLARKIGQGQWGQQTPSNVQGLISQVQQQQQQLNQVQNTLQEAQLAPITQRQQLQLQKQIQLATNIELQLDDVQQSVQQIAEGNGIASGVGFTQIQRQLGQLQQQINILEQQTDQVVEQIAQVSDSQIGGSSSQVGGWTRSPREIKLQSRNAPWSLQRRSSNVQQLIAQAQNQQHQLNQIQAEISQQQVIQPSQQSQIQRLTQQVQQLQHQQDQIELQIQQEAESSTPSSPSAINLIQTELNQHQQQLNQLQQVIESRQGTRGTRWNTVLIPGQTIRQRQKQAGQTPNQWDQDQTEQETLQDLVQVDVTPAQNEDLHQQRAAGLVEAQNVQINPETEQIQINNPQQIQKQDDVLRLLKNINQNSVDQELTQRGESFSISQNAHKYTDIQTVENLGKLISRGLLPKGEIFSVFNPDHIRQVIGVFKVLYHAQDWETFVDTAAWATVNINEGIAEHALIVALMQRGDTDLVVLPPTYEINPQYFLNSQVIQKAQNIKQLLSSPSRPRTFVVGSSYSGWQLNLDPEQALSYFLEDVGLNDFYFDYNVNFPFWLTSEYLKQGGDRRGEQAYFLHQQLLARYYMERLSNNMGEVPSINLQNQNVETGFVPSLRYPNGLEFPSRPSNVPLKRDNEVEDVQEMVRRIRDAIDSGIAIDEEGNEVPLVGEDGFETLLNMVQSNPDSPNPQYYGALEMVMRWVLGNSLEPLDQEKLAPSVLEHFETTLRDPVAWQAMKKVVELVQKYKQKLPSYNENQLHFPGVQIQNVQVSPLVTFFDKNDVDITNAVSVNPMTASADEVKILARQVRLNNRPFTVRVNINSQQEQPAVVRILLGPKHDEHGRNININENRLNFFELDKFQVQLRSGSNSIVRESSQMNANEDSVSGQDLSQQVQQALTQQQPLRIQYDDVLTAFPRRLLLPKGQRGGQQFQIMVVVTPLVESPVQQQAQQQMQQSVLGQDPNVQTGMLNQNVDGLPLGFPLDREVDESVLLSAPNVALDDVVIVHDGPEIAEAQQEIENEIPNNE